MSLDAESNSDLVLQPLSASPPRAAATISGSDDDAALMLRYRHGDTRAFETLYERHKGALYRYLRRTCRDEQVAGDLFQDVWAKVIAARDRYEVRAQFTTFLFRIAHHAAIDYFRRAEHQYVDRTVDPERVEAGLSDHPSARPDAKLLAQQMSVTFKQALDALPVEQRAVFLLYEESGLSLEEVGRITGVPMETAKSRLRYAVNKLRQALQRFRSPVLDGSTT